MKKKKKKLLDLNKQKDKKTTRNTKVYNTNIKHS